MRGVGCGVGYTLLAGTCIRLASEEKSHGDALTACQEEGATLAMPKTEELDVALRDLVKTEGGNEDHWIGGMKKRTRATWQWVDESQLGPSYQGWSPNEPNIVGYEGNAIYKGFVTKCPDDNASNDHPNRKVYFSVDGEEVTQPQKTGNKRTHGGQSSDTETDGPRPVAVGHSIIGLKGNVMYESGALRRPEDAGKTPDTRNVSNEDPESHTHHHVDRDDINEESTLPNTAGRSTSGTGLIGNATYVPGALRQDEDKGDNYAAKGDNYTIRDDNYSANGSHFTGRSGDNGNVRGDNFTARAAWRCQVGYRRITRTCVKLYTERMEHRHAQETCKRDGATLAMPKTANLDSALRDLVGTVKGYDKGYWIGMWEEHRTWYWLDNSPLENHYQGWLPGEPSNVIHFLFPPLCIQYHGYPAMWDDTECMRKKWFICQAPPFY
ncbi:CLEC4M [Branchiostoma lanceolatum]|uniref:CLEC4M protein n=1 Tax=Branchiostoma lanceolatum TaxID=7740 RepID=A0A8J9YMW8_BRALA|nr:CLEC4M [Branchiostoma lanceolatum]